jgi:hypothetical protein
MERWGTNGPIIKLPGTKEGSFFALGGPPTRTDGISLPAGPRNTVTLIYDWGNLGSVAFPFLLAITVSGILALALRRAAIRSGLPRAREPCARCRFEKGLLKRGTCERQCAVNDLPSLPLLLFIACTTFAILAAFYPSIVLTYVLPFTNPASGIPEVLLGVMLVASATASIAIAAYFAQDLPGHRELLIRGAVAGTLVGVLLSVLGNDMAGQVGAVLAPLSLGVLVIGLALEWRARLGRPALGLRAIGAAAIPLFLIAIMASVRIGEVLYYAAQSG